MQQHKKKITKDLTNPKQNSKARTNSEKKGKPK